MDKEEIVRWCSGNESDEEEDVEVEPVTLSGFTSWKIREEK